jgi:hypothetical protein
MKPLLGLTLLLLAKVSAFAIIDLGSESTFTPYDPYMRPVKQVLGALPAQTASMERVQQLMREGRSFRYSFSDPYVAADPAVTASRKSGDCKAKSLWLCDQLGDAHVRYVIGKTRRGAKLSHAWVMWQNQGRWWILDCTNTSRPILAESVSKNQYIPFYSYDKSGCYRHSTTQLMTASVAGKSNPVIASSHPH